MLKHKSAASFASSRGRDRRPPRRTPASTEVLGGLSTFAPSLLGDGQIQKHPSGNKDSNSDSDGDSNHDNDNTTQFEFPRVFSPIKPPPIIAIKVGMDYAEFHRNLLDSRWEGACQSCLFAGDIFQWLTQLRTFMDSAR